MTKKNNSKEEQTKTTSFSSLGENAKVTLRMKLSISQLKALDNKEEVEVVFKDRKIQLKCLGKSE